MLPLWDSQTKGRSGGVAGLLVTLCLVVFLAEAVLAWWRPEWLALVIEQWGWVPATWWPQRGDWIAWLPLGSSMFLHGGVAHVAGNAWFLWVFGRSLEAHVGSGRFVVIYFVGAVAATMAQTVPDLSSTVPMVGASGAISAVMGAYLVLMPWRWIIALVPWVVPIVPLPALVFLFLWFGLQVTQGWTEWGRGSAGGGVAWWAHVGGFVAGMVLAKMLGARAEPRAPRPRVRRRRRRT